MSISRPIVMAAMVASVLANTATALVHESRYYVIETDLPQERAEFIGRVMDATGKAYFDMFQGFRGKVAQKPHVRVYATRDGYMKAYAQHCGQPNPNTRGIYCGLDRIVYTYDGDDVEPVLKHECFHQFVARVIGGRLPPWTNEGLAEYFEESQLDDKAGRLKLGCVPLWRLAVLRAARKTGAWIPVTKLLALRGWEWMDTLRRGSGMVQYSEAWLLCHFLIHGDGGKYVELFDQYLGLVDQGVDGESAFKRVFGQNLTPLEHSLGVYLDGLEPDPPGDP